MDDGLRRSLPWIAGSVALIVVVAALVWWSLPEADLLPVIYDYQVL